MQETLKYVHKIKLFDTSDNSIIRDDIEIISERKLFTREILMLLKPHLGDEIEPGRYISVKIILQLTIKEWALIQQK